MPILDDTVSEGAVASNNQLTVQNHALGTDTYMYAVVSVQAEDSVLANTDFLSVKFNGVNMSPVAGSEVTHPGGQNRTEFYYMLNASLPGSGLYDILVTCAGTCAGITAEVLTLKGVKQQAPEAVATFTGTDTTLVLSLTPQTDNAMMCISGGSSHNQPFSVDWEQELRNEIGAGGTRGMLSTVMCSDTSPVSVTITGASATRLVGAIMSLEAQDPASTSGVFIDMYGAPPGGVAGKKWRDKVFGTKVIQATDANNPIVNTSCPVGYSYVDLFNCDTTKFFHRANSGGGNEFWIQDFDKDNFTVTKDKKIFATGKVLQWTFMAWHPTDPDVLYGTESQYGTYNINKIWEYKVSTEAFTLIKDFDALIDGDTYIAQMSMDENADVFAFNIFNEGDSHKSWGIYRKSDNSFREVDWLDVDPSATGINECQVEKSGQRVLCHPIGFTGWGIFKLSDSSMVTIDTGATEKGGGHSDQSFHSIINKWGSVNVYNRDYRNDPENNQTLVFTTGAGTNLHCSLQHNDRVFGYLSFNNTTGGHSFPFDNEIVQITLNNTDYRRLCSSRNLRQYSSDDPLAAVNRNGTHITFRSNRENSGRHDVFIMEIPPKWRGPQMRRITGMKMRRKKK
jgi:hypothetical protein